jgi:hypothetical protein
MEKLRKLSFFKKESIDCGDYIFKILSEVFGLIDCEKHVTSLILHQEQLNGEMGAWSESYDFGKGNEAPLATSEAILALLDSSHRSDVSNAIKRACNYLIESQNDDGGWKDMSAGQSVNDATGCAIVALCRVQQKNVMKIPQKTLDRAIDFIIGQQNADGGWSTVKGEKSKMHYTYFALWGLASYAALLASKEHTAETSGKGIQWILRNSAKNDDKALSISLDEGPSPTATALAILALENIGKEKLTRLEWKNYLRTTRRNGGWDEISDVSMVGGERRVYDFRSIPWIIEALIRSGEKLDSETIREPLKKHKTYEVSNGGFVSDVGKTVPVVWHTSWSIIMAQFLAKELKKNIKFYIDESLKNSLILSKRIENYEKKIRPEKKIMYVFGFFSAILATLSVVLLRLTTSETYGRYIWYPSAIGISLVFIVAMFAYLHERGKLNKFNASLISLAFTVFNILIGLIP